MDDEVTKARAVLKKHGIALNPYYKLVDEVGEERAKEIMRERRAKVNPKNIKGRPKKLGENAEG